MPLTDTLSGPDTDLWSSGAYRALSIESLVAALRKELGAGPDGKLDALERLVKELSVKQAELEQQNAELSAAQYELETHRDALAELYDEAPVGYLSIDAEGRILQANRTLAQLLGRDRLRGTAFGELIADDSRSLWAKRFAQLLDGGRHREVPLEIELALHGPQDTAVPVRLQCNLGRHSDGRQPVARIVVIDVSEIRRLQRREQQQLRTLAHFGRLTLIDQVSAQIAHELNQPLTAIVNYCHAMGRRLATEPPDAAQLSTILERIAHQAERSSRTVRHLRRFAARRAPDPSMIDLNRLVRDALSLVGLDGDVGPVDVDLAASLPRIHADALLIEQVVVNLVRNSLDAMADQPRGEQRLRLSTRSLDDTVVLRVEDSGPGLAPETLERIYEGFYTTKREGLGLGLAISRSIVEMHDGRLAGERFRWPDGRGGMRFSVRLPLAVPG